MTLNAVPKVLLAYPQGFSAYKNFERKVSKILSDTREFDLALANEHSDLALKYFENDQRVRQIIRDFDKEKLTGFTHAIVFDDGYSFRKLIKTIKRAGIKSRLIKSKVSKVVNKDSGDSFDVYIGRGTKWGNPYVIGIDGDRDEVIRRYQYDFDKGYLKFSKDEVLQLRGKVLGCHCKPAACHGDVIAAYLNSLDE